MQYCNSTAKLHKFINLAKKFCYLSSKDRRDITEGSLVSSYTEAIGITNGSTKGAKTVRYYSPYFMVILAYVTKSIQRRHL